MIGNQAISCVLSAFVYWLLVSSSDVVNAQKFRVCVVDGKGGFKRSAKYCPKLDEPDSKVECILGIDRLDCLRRISKGTVDFSAFTSEDLVTASNSQIPVLITNEMRYTNDKYEYEVVAIVDERSRITSKHDLKDKRLCHPGYGYETEWTKTLANYLEASVVPQMCQTQITITENRVKASSQFFKAACKAGPWVNNPFLDQQLKAQYPNLCALCDNPNTCGTTDKYWGRRGSLFCLTDGAGDVSWARLDDVRAHFGLVPGSTEASPQGYSFLCPDGSLRPVNGSSPCVWVVKPWPVIATKRTSAQDVQKMLSGLTREDRNSWQSALLNLIETFHLTITNVDPVDAIESYLQKATGFLNANSFSGCHPPRTIRMCTTSIIANFKCSWLRESATVYGIEPDFDCLKADNTTHCMQAVLNNQADVVIVPPDLLSSAINQYNLTSLFYETVNNNDKYLTVAVTRHDSSIWKLEDTEGVSACFPSYDGVAWNSVIHQLHKKSLLYSCPFTSAMAHFFGPSCVPGVPQSPQYQSLKKNCIGNQFNGDLGALRCLQAKKGDVAFVSKNAINEFINSTIDNSDGSIKMDNFKVLCETKSEGCHLSWSPVGYGMVRANSTDLWMHDTLDVFQQMDNLFGRNYKTLTTPLEMFSLFNGEANVLFHDSTVRLRNVPTVKNIDTMKRPYEDIVKSDKVCASSTAKNSALTGSVLLIIITLLSCY